MKKVGFGRVLKTRVSGISSVELYRVETTMGRVRKKSSSGGYGNSQIFKSRVRVCQVWENVGFGREISGSGIPGPITRV